MNLSSAHHLPNESRLRSRRTWRPCEDVCACVEKSTCSIWTNVCLLLTTQKTLSFGHSLSRRLQPLCPPPAPAKGVRLPNCVIIPFYHLGAAFKFHEDKKLMQHYTIAHPSLEGLLACLQEAETSFCAYMRQTDSTGAQQQGLDPSC